MPKVVVLDPGHGGRDSGAVGNKTYEKNNNLTLALKVGNILSQHGVTVKYTRTDDRDFCSGGFDVGLDLQNRIAVARQYNPDVFCSLHNNAFNHQAKGIETHCFKLGGTDEKLARSIQNQLSSSITDMINRGIKVSNLYVTRKFDGTNTSACLVEYGFIDSEENSILANMEKASVAISKGILGFLGIEYKVQGGNYRVKNCVLCSHGVDERAAGYLADFLNCSIAFKDAISKTDLDQYENVFEVGGSQVYSRSIYISGSDRFQTCKKVLDYIFSH